MNKKLIILIILVLLVTTGGVFWWWQSGKELRELNKDLPEGVKLVRTFTGEYKVTNKKDNYEIKIPRIDKKLKEIEYAESQEKIWNEKSASGLTLKYADFRIIAVSCFTFDQLNIELDMWIKKEYFPRLKQAGVTGIPYDEPLKEEKIGKLNVVKIPVEALNEGPAYFYFFMVGSKIYEIDDDTQQQIGRDIIKNSKW